MDVVPVFPLSDAVLFPDTVLPLHIFEPRYKQMIRDVVEGDRRIAIALLAGGPEQHDEELPLIHAIGTVGRIENLEELPNGRFNLHLVGTQRVEFEELPSSPTPYRLAKLIPREERTVDETNPEIVRAKIDLLASHAFLLQQAAGESGGSLAANDQLSLRAAVNGACANMPIDAQARQALLEIDDLVLRLKQAQQVVNAVLEKVVALRDDSESDAPVN